MIMQRINRALVDVVFREIDVRIHPRANFDGPTICVGNHFGGLADAILIVDSLPRMPRVVARDVIWRIPVAGQVMRALRAIPVHRRADGAVGSNDEMFASCFEALAQGDVILIFPEGVTQEEPNMAPIKTGAARIALGALARGVTDLQIVPVGLHYADKAGFRSSALVNVGAPIDVSVGDAGNPADVRALTDQIAAAMHRAAPDYPDWPTCRLFEEAATVMLNDVDAGSVPIRYGDRALLADRLYARARDREEIEGAAGSYREARAPMRLGDLPVRRVRSAPVARTERSWLLALVLILVLLPYAIAGAALAVIPWLLVRASRLFRLAPAVQASLTPALALLSFGGLWLWLLIATLGSGPGNVVLAVLLPPFFVACTVMVAERAALLWRRWLVRKLPAGPAADALVGHREAVSDVAWAQL